MRFLRCKIAPTVLGLMLALSIAACVVEPPQPPPGTVVVRQAPPAEIVEAVPPAPGPNWVWQRGHWRWNGQSYYWVHGHWVERPAGVTVWVAPRWEARGGGWFFIEGRWQ